MGDDKKKKTAFDRLVGSKDYHERMAAMSNSSWEDSKVKYLLGVFKIPKQARDVASVAERQTGKPDLTLRAFDEVYPSFPIVLGASRLGGVQLHLDKTAMIPALFKAFGAAPFMKAYEQFYETAAPRAGGRPVGLIFPRKGLKNGMVVYAADDPQIIPFCEREAFFTYVGGKSKKDRHWIIVRSFQKLLEAVHNGGHGWRPDAD